MRPDAPGPRDIPVTGGPKPGIDVRKRKQRRKDRRDSAESADVADSASPAGCGDNFGNCDISCDGCDGCGGPCDFLVLVRLSTLLLVAAGLVPETGGAPLVRRLLRGYQRHVSRFTPRCPQSPSCSAFALAAVDTLGPRRGLAAAARRVRDCGRPTSHRP